MSENEESVLEALSRTIRQRRTIEIFRSEPVPQETILQAIELACWAPNHKHTEPWRFHLLGPETCARLIELNTKLVRDSKGEAAAQAKQQRWSRIPGWLALTSAVSDDPLRSEEDYAACCCAAQNMMLSLWACGIGMKWGTGPVTRNPAFADLLGFEPGQRKVVGLFAYGYPESVPQSRRRPITEFLRELP